ncbi:MAG: aminotransferase class IV [Planctomycetota bacterium]|nr:aminotransferase class IV [Planctomycetota bacterium]
MSTARYPVLVDGVMHASAPRSTADARGFGVFDTLLAEDGLRWFEDRHLARLRAACDHFAIPAFERWDVASELARFGAGLGARAALVRTTATRDPRTGQASLVLEARAPRVVPERGVELLLVDAVPDPLGAWKTTNRLARVLQGEQAERAGCFDALLRLPTGAVVEAARANLFAVVDGLVRTPPLAAGGLPGIVRGLLLETLADVREAELCIEDLRRASEVWLTSSGARIAPVRAVRGLREDLPGSAGPRAVEAREALRGQEAEFRRAYRARTPRL